jgi:hypothetical protein
MIYRKQRLATDSGIFTYSLHIGVLDTGLQIVTVDAFNAIGEIVSRILLPGIGSIMQMGDMGSGAGKPAFVAP